MTTRSQWPPALRSARVAAMVAIALAGAAACGPAAAGPSGSPAAGAGGATATAAAASASATPGGGGSVPASAARLCTNISHLDTLAVSLTRAPAPGDRPVALPAGLTVRDPARVQAVAAGLCALPAMAAGPVSCPADLGGSYRFVFAAGPAAYPPVLIRMTGCRTVSGLGPARTTSAALWVLLARELGTRHPMIATPAAP